MQIKADYVSGILHKAWRQRHRLQLGLKKREEYCNQLIAGEDVTHYPRALKIQDAADLVKDFLLDIAKDFDRVNPEDKLSTLDAMDILRLVARSFK